MVGKRAGKGINGEARMEMEEESGPPSPHDESSYLLYFFIMNIVIWNSRVVLKPRFQNHVRELTQNHNPALLVITETRLGGDRAKEITDSLPFEGAIHFETIGHFGGIWLLWNSNMVEVV